MVFVENVMYSGRSDVLSMPQASTLSHIADLVIRRVLGEGPSDADLAEALERAYPFDESVESRRIWLDALLRHAVASRMTLQ